MFIRNKKIMSIVAMFFVVACGFAPTLSTPASADLTDAACTGFQDALGSDGCGADAGQSDLRSTVSTAIDILSVAVAVISVFMIILGGFRYVTSGGDPGSTKGARDTVIYALVGLAIVAVSQSLVKYVVSKIGG